MRSEEVQRWIDIGDEHEARIVANRAVFVEAVKAVIAAAQEYLPPDGISKDEFINRTLGAIDNAEIVAALKEIEGADAEVARIKARSAHPHS